MQELKKEFPMLHGKPLIYLDTAATAQKPKEVIEAIHTFYKEQYGTVHRALYALAVQSTELYNAAREKVRAFLNARAQEEIIFTRGTTEALNLVASSFGRTFLQPGDCVLISEIEHHSNIVPWQMICKERGAHLLTIPVNDRGELELAEIDPRVKIVSIAHVSNVIGTLHPIKKIIEMARKQGAKICIDAAQSAPHMPLDVQDLDCDFLAFSGHKLYGPTGIGILYGKAELLEQLPPVQGGGDMIHEVTLQETTYAAAPLKFEAGTPMIAEVVGLGAAIDFLTKIGWSRIQREEENLKAQMLNGLKQIEDLRLIGEAKERGGIFTFAIDGVHPLDLGTLLDLKGVAIRTGHLCSQPAMKRFGVTHTARASLGLYNTLEEIDRFLYALQEVVAQCRSFS